MQALHDEYSEDGLVVLAVPSEDFNQEYSDNKDVVQFCRVDTGLTFPITEITSVRGPDAHPFYRWLAQEHREAPNLNFNKALIGPDGALIGFWGGVDPSDCPCDHQRNSPRPAVKPVFIGSEIYRGSSYGAAHPLHIPRVSTVMDMVRALGGGWGRGSIAPAHAPNLWR